MSDTTSAGADPKGQSAQDVAHPEGGSQEKSPGDDWMKRSQFIAAINNVTAKVDALTRENQELRAAQTKKEEPKPPTRAELLRLVATGDLNQEQADALWEKQIVERSKREAAAEVAQGMGAHQRDGLVQAELSGYKELVPAAWEQGSEEHTKAAKEYAHLVKMGDAPGLTTEAKALRAAFGDIETLRQSKSARPGPADTHSETGGGKPSGGGTKDPIKGLTPVQKDYYEKGIKAGRYPKGWDDVKEELKFARR